ncbi:MAG: hypothetical protein J6O60_07785 [Lachnospiraceae bacterium]|nr:hypothetical protein [Lachnospiraceae bacterium]
METSNTTKSTNQGHKMTREERLARNAKRRQAIIRRRRIAIAAIIAAIVLVVVIAIVAVTKLFGNEAETSTLTINDDGSVVCEEVVDFDKDYYSKADLKSFIKKQVEEFNKANNTSIKVNKVKAGKDSAYAKVTYGSVAEYADFTHYPLYSGSVNAALNDGYNFVDSFVNVKDGTKGDEVEIIDVTSDKEANVIVVKENITVTVPGKITYVSDKNTTMVDESTVAIAQADGNNDATQVTYIVYKPESK